MDNYNETYYNHPERVGFGKRFLATLLDNMIVAIIATTLVFTVGTKLLEVLHLDDETEFSIFSDNAADDEAEELLQSLNINPNILFALTMLSNLTTLLYSMSELFTNASPGKRIMGIAIGSDTGEPASRALLARRWALRYGAYLLALFAATTTLSSIISFLVTCGFLLALGAQRQALHDMAVHSAVYYREDVTAS